MGYTPRPKQEFICPCGCGRLVIGTAAKRYFEPSCALRLGAKVCSVSVCGRHRLREGPMSAHYQR